MVLFVPASPMLRRKTLTKGSWSLSRRGSLKAEQENDLKLKKQHTAEMENTSSRKHVQFDMDNLVTVIPETAVPHTERELLACWYQRMEYTTTFEKDRILTALEYMNSRRVGSHHFDEEHHTARGLENIYDNKLRKRQNCERHEVLKLLREETLRQKADGTYPDLEGFRRESLKHTRSAADRAILLAHDDAKACRPKGVNPVVHAISRSATMSMKLLRRRSNGEVTSHKRS